MIYVLMAIHLVHQKFLPLLYFIIWYIGIHVPVTSTVMVALSFPIGLVTIHVYVPPSLVVALSME